jgi:hypothetical protein
MPNKSRLDQTQGEAPEAQPIEGDSAPIGAAMWSDTVDLEADQFGIPFMALQQGLSKAVTAPDSTVKMGDYLIQGYEPHKVVTVIPLKFGVSRNYSTQVDGELVQHCYAPTAPEKLTHGIAVDDEGPGIPCAQCSLKDWQPTDKVDRNGRKVNDKPPCTTSFDFLCYSVTDETLCRIGFRGASSGVGRQLAMLGKTRGLGNVMVALSSERVTTRGNTYAKATCSILTPDPAMLEAARFMVALPTVSVVPDDGTSSEPPF